MIVHGDHLAIRIIADQLRIDSGHLFRDEPILKLTLRVLLALVRPRRSPHRNKLILTSVHRTLHCF